MGDLDGGELDSELIGVLEMTLDWSFGRQKWGEGDGLAWPAKWIGCSKNSTTAK
jgi:hypothetical protein